MPDFGLIQTPNFAQAALGGYTAGLAAGRDKRRQAALDTYTSNPEAGITALNSVDPELAQQLRTNQDEQNARQLRAAALQGPQGASQAPQALGAPPAVEGADVGAMPQPQAPQMQAPQVPDFALNNDAVKALFIQDPKAAADLMAFSQKATEQQRAQVLESQNALAAVGAHLQTLPYEQRKQELQRLAPELAAHGVTNDMVAGFDPTDAVIGATVAQALGVKGILEQRDKAFQRQDKMADNARMERSLALQARGQDITLRGQDMTDARSRQQIGATVDGVTKTIKRDEGDLRKQFEARPEVKDWRAVSQSFRQIRSAAAAPSAQNDIAIIFSYMKMLDPGSVVREGEFATAQNAAGVPDRIRNMWNKAQEGERLNPEQRKGMVSSAAAVVNAMKPRYDAVANEYRSYASDYGANPDRVARPSPTAGPNGGAKVIRYDANGKRIG